MNPILIVNGPNLNLLGSREVEKYGQKDLSSILERIEKSVLEKGFKPKCFQSNHEGELIDFIQREGKSAEGMVINAGAYTHTSIAIRDAILSVGIPFVEVHLTNVYKREAFRHHSYLSDIAIGVIAGFGDYSYDLGLAALIDFISKKH